MKSLHQDFKVNDNGFIINPQWPFLGATPDGRFHVRVAVWGL